MTFKVHNKNDENEKLSFDFKLITTTIHESGHVIMGLLNFMQITDVGIELKKDKKSKDLGYTNFHIALDYKFVANAELANKLLMSELYINYGGLAAEKLFYKDICGTDKIPMVLKYGSWEDRIRVAELIKKHNLASPGTARYSFKKKILAKTQRSLEQYWIDVKLISHNLFSKRKLFHADIKNILTKKSPNKVFWKKQFKDIETIFAFDEVNNEKLFLALYN